jgi:hypothetical protein
MDTTIQIDSFNTNLNGCRILCQGPFSKSKYPPILESIEKLREPFKRKILISNGSLMFNKYLSLSYDVIFNTKDIQEWSLILTYITYAPTPSLIVMQDIAVPDAVWQKLSNQLTVVHIISNQLTNLANYKHYDAIFFSPLDDNRPNYPEMMYKILQSIYKSNYSNKEHKEILQELRVAAAGIVWTKHKEQLIGGSLYWYDPVTNNIGDIVSKTQLSELFSLLSEYYNSKLEY